MLSDVQTLTSYWHAATVPEKEGIESCLAISGSPDAEPNASTSFRGCTVPLKQACPERGPE